MKRNPELDRLKDWNVEFPAGKKEPTIDQLNESGFCRLKLGNDVQDAIARIDRQQWLDSVHVDFPGSHGWDPHHAAHMYRMRHGVGYRNVPKHILDDLLWSDEHDAPCEFLYHWRFPQKQRAKQAKPKEEEDELPPLPEHERIAMKVVIVLLPDETGSHEHYYFAPTEAKAGDYVIVHALPESPHIYAMGTIEREDEDLEGMARTAIVAFFNEDFYHRAQAQMDQLGRVKARLQRKLRQYEERDILELIAKDDPETRDLLDRLKALEK